MTTTFQVPTWVAQSIARREAAQSHVPRCVYGCDVAARLYPCGARCDEHSPWAVAGRPNPDTQVDPTRTADALRVRMVAQADVAPMRAIRAQPADNSGTTPGQPADKITERFRAFHAQNPHVYARVVELVVDAVLRGDRRIGVGALFEQLRYSERTETHGDRYRLNNDYRAPMVRLLLEEHPEWSDLFELRERKTA